MKRNHPRLYHPCQIIAAYKNLRDMVRKLDGHFYLTAPYQRMFCQLCGLPVTKFHGHNDDD